jgi:hypothetical protein
VVIGSLKQVPYRSPVNSMQDQVPQLRDQPWCTWRDMLDGHFMNETGRGVVQRA